MNHQIIYPKLNYTLMAPFFFAEAMKEPQVLEDFLSIFLEKDIHLLHQPKTEKSPRETASSSVIQMEIYGIDESRVIYEIYSATHEIQPEDPNHPESYMIIMTPVDPFGSGAYRYTFSAQSMQSANPYIPKDAVQIIYNTKGHKKGHVSDEAIALLRYMHQPFEPPIEYERLTNIHHLLQLL